MTARLGPLLLTVLSALGCGASTATSVTAPASTRCQPTVTSSATTYGPDGGTGNLAIDVARECSWSAASEAAWIALTSAREGQGAGSVTYRVANNGEPVARRGAVSIGEVRVELSQDGAPCRYQVAAPTEALPGDGGEHVIGVRTHAACPWTAASTVSWITLAPRSGRGDASVRMTLPANDGAARNADVIVAGERIVVVQLGRGAPPAPQPTPPAPAPAPEPDPPPAPDPAPAPPAPPPAESEVELEGRVEGLSGACPSLVFRLAGETVWTDEETEFEKGPCKGIAVGSELEIEGRRMPDGRVRAEEVEIRKK